MTLAHSAGEAELSRRPGKRQLPRGGARGWWPAARLALGLLLSALGVWLALRGVQLGRVGAVLGQARPGLLLAALAADLALVAAGAARWQSLFVPPSVPARGRLFQILTIAQLANAVLPARPGLLVRVYLAGHTCPEAVPGGGRAGGTAAALTTIVGEKVAEGLGLCLVAGALVPFVPLAGWLRVTVGVSAGLLLAALATLVGLAWHREAAGRWLKRVLGRVPWLLSRAQEVLEALGAWRQRRAVLALCAWSAAVWGLSVARSQLLLGCLDIHVPWTAPLVILVLSQVGNRLPATPAGIGVLHYASVLALSLYGVDGGVALGYGVLFHLVMYLPTSLLGLAFLVRSGVGLRQLEQSADNRELVK